MTKDEALKLALEALKFNQANWRGKDNAITSIKWALAQPAQKPAAYLCKPDQHGLFDRPTPDKACEDCFPVYAAPPQRPWVGLTDDETETLIHRFDGDPHTLLDEVNARLKGKNT